MQREPQRTAPLPKPPSHNWKHASCSSWCWGMRVSDALDHPMLWVPPSKSPNGLERPRLHSQTPPARPPTRAPSPPAAAMARLHPSIARDRGRSWQSLLHRLGRGSPIRRIEAQQFAARHEMLDLARLDPTQDVAFAAFAHPAASSRTFNRLRASNRCHDTVFSVHPNTAAASPWLMSSP